MAQYVIAYRDGATQGSPEEGAAQRAKFNDWLADLGDAVVNPGMPLASSRLVTQAGVSAAPPEHLIGFSIISAESLESALAIAQRCPFLEIGTIEVGEVLSM